MSTQKVTPGRNVVFTPSENSKKKFKNKQKDTYAAVVTDVNDGSVDLTVFGVGEIVYFNNIQHVDNAAENRSHWDWPVINQ